jgi:hypothetical protein
MLARLARRELWHHRWTLLLQIASLSIAIAVVGASEHLRGLSAAGPVPGSACAEDVFELAGASSNGTIQSAWTPAQARALLLKIADTPSADLMTSVAQAETKLGPRYASIAYVGPAYFDLMCVPRRNLAGGRVTGPFVSGAVVDESVNRVLIEPRELHANDEIAAVQALTRGFKGAQYEEAPVEAWLPMALAKNLTEDSSGIGNRIATVHVLAKPGNGQSRRHIVRRLQAVLAEQPSLFSGIDSIVEAPLSQIGARAAAKVSNVALLLRFFAGALLFMVLVNLLIFHAGRLSLSQALAKTLIAVGAPPSAIRRYAAIEPLVLGLISAAIGALLSLPLAQAAAAAVTLEAMVFRAPSMATTHSATIALTALVTGLVIWVRWATFSTRTSPVRGKASRLLLKYVPDLLAVQVALALLTLALAAQAAVGWFRALPSPPNFPLQGLSVVEFFQDNDAPVQNNLDLRWESSWRELGVPNYRAVLAKTHSPFLPNQGNQGALGYEGRTVSCYFAEVGRDFFSVLGASFANEEVFPNAPSYTGLKRSAPDQAVLNAQAAHSLFGEKALAAGTVIRVGLNPFDRVSEKDQAAVVRGVFDDGVIGAIGATGKIDISSLSMQAGVPVAYFPIQIIQPHEPIHVFVRHPVAETPMQVASNILPAVKAVFPTAKIVESKSATELFRRPLSRERSMALVLGLLAAASLAIGMLGLISLLSMLMQNLKVEMAVNYAVGAARKQAARVLLRRVLSPFVAGLLIGALPTMGALFVLGKTLEVMSRAGAVGPVLAMTTLLTTFVVVLWQHAGKVTRANFMDWLRYE